MVVFAIAIFGLSLLAISGLFALKAWEMRTSRTLAPQLRAHADEAAAVVKRVIERSQKEARKLPPEILNLARTILHDAALGSASLARYLERKSHDLADMVSHRASFERRETKNDFLKNVRDYKSGATAELDSRDESGQNS